MRSFDNNHHILIAHCGCAARVGGSEKPFGMHALLLKIEAALDSSRMRFVKWSEKRDREARLALLTGRERSLALAVTECKSSREISETLGISSRTVEDHRARIMEKLDVTSTVDLVKLFL